ncbi:MAG: hypothetical protein GEV06_05720 [Luteitalea sp.]|nr:hypothetical protein [Luteitalea sp.]
MVRSAAGLCRKHVLQTLQHAQDRLRTKPSKPLQKAFCVDRSERRLQCPPVVESLEEAGDDLFTFLRFPRGQWKALRTTNALERINEEFRRPTKTQASLPSQDAVLLLLFGLLRTGQVKLRALDGYHEMGAVQEAA